MTELGDAVGTIGEGSLLARAVAGDPSVQDGHFREQACLNCGTVLTGPHCHQCGQQAHLHRTMGAFLHDLLHGVLHFEGRTWRTLPLLALKPGQLTRRYIEGERKRFVSPMALFLFSVFLMFGVFSALGMAPNGVAPGPVVSGIDTARAEATRLRDEARKELAALPASSPRRAKVEKDIADAEDDLAALDTARGFDLSTLEVNNFNVTGIEAIDKGLLAKWKDNPGLMIYKLQSNSYKFSWLLIPLSVPFLWLLFFWKRRYGGYDHAVFITYSLAFMSLLFIALSVLGVIGVPVVALVIAGLLIPPLHIYKQLRGAYQIGRFGALWRLSLLMIFILVILVLFLEALLLLGAF